MALFTESEVRNRARVETEKRGRSVTASQITMESAVFDSTIGYDIFLSHSVRDAEIVLGVKKIIEDLGYSVYVDWIDDKKLDRSNVTQDTANILRERMNASNSLFYLTTENSEHSKWMPWECGYFDGIKEKVAIIPVAKNSSDTEYKGHEYLGIYPYVIEGNSQGGNNLLYIFKNKSKYLHYDLWVKEKNESLSWNTL